MARLLATLSIVSYLFAQMPSDNAKPTPTSSSSVVVAGAGPGHLTGKSGV